MRIIAGEFRGRTLVTVRDRSVRPAMDRVKSTIFNMLQNRLSLIDAQVLDLFAGSGSLGFEALSRGAAHVIFVETGKEAAALIQKNAENLGCEDRCSIIEVDALQYIARERETFNLIFADPPYKFEEIAALPRLIGAHKLLRKEGFLIIEHWRRASFEPAPELTLNAQKEFGATRVSFYS